MKKIEIIKRVVTTKEGKSFDTFKAVQKNGKLIDCKFTKDVKNLPDESCFMYVEEDKINIDKNKKYPTLWVKKVVKYEESISKETTLDEFDDAE